ncbi:MAG: hypothetical protein JRD43_07360 [Deltaproteobacteria bacterium]|nr:hypothetical protein [Deltaproteobacteria bacterium]MBW2595882.1 hypothetical protein [Deltaproteobacteria bacterium]
MDEPTILDLEQTVYALDATTIGLCMSMFPWLAFVKTMAPSSFPLINPCSLS